MFEKISTQNVRKIFDPKCSIHCKIKSPATGKSKNQLCLVMVFLKFSFQNQILVENKLNLLAFESTLTKIYSQVKLNSFKKEDLLVAGDFILQCE